MNSATKPSSKGYMQMNKMKEMWNRRYATKDYVYGVRPNVFLKDSIEKHKLAGKLLLPAEGEGRNAVYAATKGLDVTAFDISIEGKKKALKLAKRKNVKITYEIGEFFELNVINEQFDAAALIFAHFPPLSLSKYHEKIGALIKPGGLIILEGFSKSHLKLQKENLQIGEPKNIDFLFSTNAIQKDFSDFEVIQLEEVELPLNEGILHKGTSSVIRFVGKKGSIQKTVS